MFVVIWYFDKNTLSSLFIKNMEMYTTISLINNSYTVLANLLHAYLTLCSSLNLSVAIIIASKMLGSMGPKFRIFAPVKNLEKI